MCITFKKVRVLDTPGLADTRGVQQDDLHKKSIATQLEQHIGSVTAVLILANGTVPRVTVGTDYALSTLSAIFPQTLVHNISFMFTNVLSPLHWNFSPDTLPDRLKSAPHFLLNNPIALQKKYLRLRDHPNMKKGRAELRNAVKAAEQNALEMLVDLFDWLDTVESQPTMEIVGNPQSIQTDARPSMHRTEARNTTVSCLPALHQRSKLILVGTECEPEAASNFDRPDTEESEVDKREVAWSR